MVAMPTLGIVPIVSKQPKENRMIALPETVTLPLKLDEHGAIRVSGRG